MRKTFVFASYQKLRHGSHQSILLSVMGQSYHFDVPCKRRSSVNSGASLRRFDDVPESL